MGYSALQTVEIEGIDASDHGNHNVTPAASLRILTVRFFIRHNDTKSMYITTSKSNFLYIDGF